MTDIDKRPTRRFQRRAETDSEDENDSSVTASSDYSSAEEGDEESDYDGKKAVPRRRGKEESYSEDEYEDDEDDGVENEDPGVTEQVGSASASSRPKVKRGLRADQETDEAANPDQKGGAANPEFEPARVPTAGSFFMHDDRDSGRGGRGRGARGRGGGKKLWTAAEDKWQHDKFEELQVNDDDRPRRGGFRRDESVRGRGRGRGRDRGERDADRDEEQGRGGSKRASSDHGNYRVVEEYVVEPAHESPSASSGVEQSRRRRSREPDLASRTARASRPSGSSVAATSANQSTEWQPLSLQSPQQHRGRQPREALPADAHFREGDGQGGGRGVRGQGRTPQSEPRSQPRSRGAELRSPPVPGAGRGLLATPPNPITPLATPPHGFNLADAPRGGRRGESSFRGGGGRGGRGDSWGPRPDEFRPGPINDPNVEPSLRLASPSQAGAAPRDDSGPGRGKSNRTKKTGAAPRHARPAPGAPIPTALPTESLPQYAGSSGVPVPVPTDQQPLPPTIPIAMTELGPVLGQPPLAVHDGILQDAQSLAAGMQLPQGFVPVEYVTPDGLTVTPTFAATPGPGFPIQPIPSFIPAAQYPPPHFAQSYPTVSLGTTFYGPGGAPVYSMAAVPPQGSPTGLMPIQHAHSQIPYQYPAPQMLPLPLQPQPEEPRPRVQPPPRVSKAARIEPPPNHQWMPKGRVSQLAERPQAPPPSPVSDLSRSPGTTDHMDANLKHPVTSDQLASALKNVVIRESPESRSEAAAAAAAAASPTASSSASVTSATVTPSAEPMHPRASSSGGASAPTATAAAPEASTSISPLASPSISISTAPPASSRLAETAPVDAPSAPCASAGNSEEAAAASSVENEWPHPPVGSANEESVAGEGSRDGNADANSVITECGTSVKDVDSSIEIESTLTSTVDETESISARELDATADTASQGGGADPVAEHDSAALGE